tara:strand:+ start:431 stop:1507 length:1077 start_codon:yes stop_codon:yes gene_type:complete
MKIQKPTITSPTITDAGSLTGAGANLTGSFSGAMDISSFDGNAATTISGSSTALSASIASDVATNTAKLTANTSNVTSAGALMDSEVTSLALVKGLTAAKISGSSTSLSSSLAARHVTAEAFKTSFDAAIGLNSDDVTILGDLIVQGTQTELQTTTLNVEDINITVASGAADSAAADGAGLTVAGASATFTYSHSGTKWNMNKPLDVTGNITTSGTLDVNGSGNSEFTSHLQAHCLGIGTAPSETTGEIRAAGDITAYYSSDERLKENIEDLDGALDKVNKLRGVKFDWKELNEEERSSIHSHEGQDIGVIAQEVQEVYPELVHEREHGYLTVDYVKLTAVLIQAVKELSAKVDELSK